VRKSHDLVILSEKSATFRDQPTGSAPALLLLLAPCQNEAMPRIDRYDIIGIVLVVLVVALWVLHFSLPPQPPLVVVP